MPTTQEIIHFWVDETGPEGWYNGSDDLDGTIRNRFLADWEAARAGQRDHWQDTAEGALGFLILTDQFPRNMFRGDARSFATDAAALACAEKAIAADLDLQIDLPTRQFFYMPFMHSEEMAMQDRCIELMQDRMSDPRGAGDTLHARVHREIIRKFGRFPYRNDVLERQSSAEEIAFIQGGGYASIREKMQKNDA
ncbi:Uncharacterized conserved protein, DUF924 family [Aliiroseovarius halocynthiae]|uniref:DUF924 domain-containing protein n=1 Tax=Aliiroseovarius halocynthiae TaxID=985055 RepID=A0A545SWK0_9RHOB|nr:DUF924 family protein [Aliiroseovarius halocynthiae]TQV69352.1 DUF924 domain-containing protein [Aliiroseovarius halocynthiae]SMR72418.1 Uncharacterized conserved protein, DUF924 family [Aliiroseovarius halocynthiae]